MHSDSKTILTGLQHESLIRVSGPDADAFLQGQLSTDIGKLTQEQGQFSSWNNAKGRVVTLLRLFRHGGEIFMALPQGLLAPVLKRLALYVLRSKVELADAGMDIARLGLAGPEAPALLMQAGVTAPQQTYGVVLHGGVHVVRLHGAVPRYAMYGDADGIAALMQKLKAAGAQEAGEDAWVLAKIRAGEPTVYPESSEYFVAQMLDLDRLGGIDFKKGCYTGQEVIARAHYRGAVKRHLARAESHSTASLAPGSDIHTPGHDSPVAEVVDARLDEDGVWQMLLVVQDDYRDAQLVHAASGTQVKLI